MRVILFQNQFADKILNGDKNQTIRQNARCKVGHKLSLRKWMGKPYRSKQQTLLDVSCTGVSDVTIDHRGVIIDSEYLPFEQTDSFAQADGFTSFKEMCAWFDKVHGLPFAGNIIKWGINVDK